MKKIKRALRAANPYPHVDLNGYEVTAYPDDVVGLYKRGSGYGILLSPDESSRLGRALMDMACVASEWSRAQRPLRKRPSHD